MHRHAERLPETIYLVNMPHRALNFGMAPQESFGSSEWIYQSL